MKYPTKCAFVIDNGVFPSWAVRLAKDFGRVLYYAHWETTAKSEDLHLGDGLPGVERAENVYDYIDDADVFVFPDVGEGALQLHLESIGKRVWGARRGEELELYRSAAKKHFKRIGLPIAPYVELKGFEELKRYLRTHDDRYVKIDATRGDMESFHSPSWRLSEQWLDRLESKLGGKKRIMKFVVEAPIRPATEIGYDGYCVDGEFPSIGMAGLEVKNQAYLGTAALYDELPEAVTFVNGKLASTLASYRYRSFFSTEIRVTEDGTPYLIDPTCRAGCPPSELYQLMIENIAEIIYEGAGGKLIEPEYKAKWGAQVFLESELVQTDWVAVNYPPEIIDHVKLIGWCRIDGQDYVVPQGPGATQLGSVVACADNMDEAIEQAKELASRVECYGLKVDADALDDAKEEIETLAEQGQWLRTE
jgi:hypothetical protein